MGRLVRSSNALFWAAQIDTGPQKFHHCARRRIDHGKVTMSSVAFEGEGMPSPRQGLWVSGTNSCDRRTALHHILLVCFLKGHFMDLQDRSILLTRAGGGNGAALALELAARSARLTLGGRRRGLLDEVAAAVRERGGQAHVLALDLTGPGAPAAAGVEQDALRVVREGATRTAMITWNREDPAAVDRTLLAHKGALEESVAGHSSL